MNKLAYLCLAGAAFTVSCQNNGDQKEGGDVASIQKEAIAVHDEIMPQISVFDKNTVRIDSILTNLAGVKATHTTLDTVATRVELTALKSKLDQATASMEDWMKGYSLDSTDTAYQQNELEKVRAMKKLFEEVSTESKAALSKF